jgi:hypothetical protein
MNVTAAVNAVVSTIVSGLMLGRTSSLRTAPFICRRSPASIKLTRAPAAGSSGSDQAAIAAESRANTTESPKAGSQVAVPNPVTGPPPTSGQGR